MLLLVRHGRTEANASGLLLGRLDPVLDEVGRAQVGAVAEVIARSVRPPALIVTSPLARTRATAAAIAEATGAPVDIDERWIELDYGDFDGRPVSEVPAGVWAEWRADPLFAPPGGESLVALRERVTAAIEELVPRARDNDIVVVSHVSPIKAAVAWALGTGDDVAWHLYLSPGSICRVAMSDLGGVLHSFNEVPVRRV